MNATPAATAATLPWGVLDMHPLKDDSVQGPTFMLHCCECGDYMEDLPLSQGVPAVDLLCDDCC